MKIEKIFLYKLSFFQNDCDGKCFSLFFIYLTKIKKSVWTCSFETDHLLTLRISLPVYEK